MSEHELNSTPCSAWDLPLHHPRSPFQSRSVVDWVFSKECQCGARIKLYDKQCPECKQNTEGQQP